MKNHRKQISFCFWDFLRNKSIAHNPGYPTKKIWKYYWDVLPKVNQNLCPKKGTNYLCLNQNFFNFFFICNTCCMWGVFGSSDGRKMYCENELLYKDDCHIVSLGTLICFTPSMAFLMYKYIVRFKWKLEFRKCGCQSHTMSYSHIWLYGELDTWK